LKLTIFGPLAHLVERTHGMGEASGSSPLWSTTVFTFIYQYGFWVP